MLPPLMDLLGGGMGGKDKKIRTIGLIGDVTEEKASDVIYGLLALRESGVRQELKDPLDPAQKSLQLANPWR